MKRKTWRSKLTKGELAHLKLMESNTLSKLKINLEAQAMYRRENPHTFEPCFDCKGIAVKLGMEV